MGIIFEESAFDKEIRQQLERIEARLSRIETHLQLDPLPEPEKPEEPASSPGITARSSEALEFQIGQFWFAKAGITVLAIGIAFLLTFPYQNLPAIVPSLTGYLLVGLIFTLSQIWRKSFAYISGYLLGGGMVLFYFATLRLYFFSGNSVTENKTVELGLLLLVTAINLIISRSRKSSYLTAVSITFGYITAIVSNSPFFWFLLNAVFAGLIVFKYLRHGWEGLFIFGILATFLSHFAWFLNNPVLGHRIVLQKTPAFNLIFLLLYIAIFAWGSLQREKSLQDDKNLMAGTFLNSAGGYGLFLIITVTRFQSHLGIYHFAAFLLFLSFAVIFWLRDHSRYSTFFYAIIGYTALSVVIISQFKMPDLFIWLGWQSLLVIITALWFRSKFIVVANFIIFIFIFLAFLILAGKVTAVSLSFGFVALLSARIMNWQKHRLELKTELMRNAYLVAAFFIFPYALYHSVPKSYIGISWMAVAIAYYIISLILNNKKYRWMALLTLLLTVGYVFIIGIAGLDPVYRIISFIALGTVLIIISLLYARNKGKAASAKAGKKQ